jgi:phosphoglycerate dehydrogenase-like enzyme
MSVKIYTIDNLPKALFQEIRDRLSLEKFSLVSAHSESTNRDHLDQLEDTQVLIHSMTDITPAMLDAAPQLKVVIKYQMRPGKADIHLLKQRGIAYIQVPCMALFSVAEFTVMMILVLAKEFIKAYEDMKTETWLPDLQPQLTTQTKYPYNWVSLNNLNTLFGRVIGIIGIGTVGKNVARMVQPFGMQVMYYDLYRLSSLEEQSLNLLYAPLDELLGQADFVTLHLKYTEQTENFMGDREFGLMKSSAFFINTSRGRVVNEDALFDVLKNHSIAGAALDVFWYEPLPSNSPLRTLDNVILTPHVAGIPLEANAGMEAEMIVDYINHYLTSRYS